MYILYFVMYIYRLWKKLEARLGVAYDFWVFLRCLGKQDFLKMNMVMFSMLKIIYVIHMRLFWHGPLAFLDLHKLGFRGMFDSPGVVMFDRVGILIFVVSYIYNDYENFICEKDAFHMEYTYSFSCKISSGLVYIS